MAAKTTGPADSEFAEETWVYGGIRLGTDNKRWGSFTDAAGEVRQYAFRKMTGFVLGGHHTVLVAHSGGSVWVRGIPAWQGTRIDDEDLRRQWAAEERAALIREAEAKAVKAGRRDSDLDAALAPLLKIVTGLRTTADVDALNAYVLRQIYVAWIGRSQNSWTRGT